MGFGDGNYLAEPPSGEGLVITDLFHIVEAKADDPGIRSTIDTKYPNVAIITHDQTNQFGGIWAKEQLDLTMPFSVEMYLYYTHADGVAGRIADGMTFTLHNDPAGLNAIGGAGEGLGAYRGRKWTGEYYNGEPVTVEHGKHLENSLVVEIDTYANVGPYVFDVPEGGAHCAIFPPWRNFFYENEHQNRFGIWLSQRWVKFEASWTPKANDTGTLTYTFDGVTKTYNIDSSNTSTNAKAKTVSGLFSGTKVYWGFTGATAFGTAVHAAAITRLPLQGIKVTKDALDENGSSINNNYALEGETITYTVNVTPESLNGPLGPIVIEDTIQSDLEYVSADKVTVLTNNSPEEKIDPTIAGNKLTINTGISFTDLSDWITVKFNVTVKTGIEKGTVLTNTAVVLPAPGLAEPKESNSTAVTVISKTDPVKSVSYDSKSGKNNGSVNIGDSITYEIVYANDDPAASANIRVIDVLPMGVDYVNSSPVGDYNSNTHAVIWDLPNVPANTIGKVYVTVTVNNSAISAIDNIAGVTVGAGAEVSTNHVINPLAAEKPVKSVAMSSLAGKNGSRVKKNDIITYNISYRNDTANNGTVTITDPLTVGVDFISASPSGYAYDAMTHTVTWTLDNIPSGESGIVSVTVQVNSKAVTKIANYAIVKELDEEPQLTNVVSNPLQIVNCLDSNVLSACRKTISGQKIWNDSGDTSKRPPTIDILLLRDGIVYQSISMETETDRNFSFRCVPLNKNSTAKYVYTVDESKIPDGYTKTVTGTDIINTLNPFG